MKTPEEKIQDLRAALGALLDSVDYTAGNCSLNQSVADVLDKRVIKLARTALDETRPKPPQTPKDA